MTDENTNLSELGTEAVGQISGVTGSLLDALAPYIGSNPSSARCARIAQERYEEASVWAVKAVVHHEKKSGEPNVEDSQEDAKSD